MHKDDDDEQEDDDGDDDRDQEGSRPQSLVRICSGVIDGVARVDRAHDIEMRRGMRGEEISTAYGQSRTHNLPFFQFYGRLTLEVYFRKVG